MEVLKPRYSSDEFTQRGQSLYARGVRPHVTEEDEGKFVAIDIETGAYELDPDEYTATENLLKRREYWVAGAGPSQVTEIVESILSLGPDFGPISSFLRSKRGLLSGIHVKSEMAL